MACPAPTATCCLGSTPTVSSKPALALTLLPSFPPPARPPPHHAEPRSAPPPHSFVPSRCLDGPSPSAHPCLLNEWGARCGFSDSGLFLVPLLALTLALADTNFPQFLPCELHRFGVVDCDRRSLGCVPSFPGATPSALANVTTLLLRHNHISHLQPAHFSHLRSLRRLFLRWNCAPINLTALHLPCHMVIDQGTFLELPKLEFLDLSGNSITSIPELPRSLTGLVISRTMILALDSVTFSGLPSLRSLYMDGNCYYKNPCGREVDVPSGALAHLHHLTNLSLKYDNLTSVPRGLPASLQMLLISSNRIISLAPQDFAGLPALRVLDVGGNCRRCDHAYNPCVECPKGYPEVHPDTFSHLGALESLILSDNSLSQLDPRWFQNLTNLTGLDLSENFLSEDITNTTAFQSLAKLKKLKLAFNYHKKVSFARLHLAPSFGNLKSLEVLDMTGIFFRSLTRATLQPLLGLPSFQKLLLPMNFISKADLSVFGQFHSLKFVDLSDNKVTGVSNAANLSRPPTASTGPLLGLKKAFHPPAFEYFMPQCNSSNFILDLSQNNLITIQPEMFDQLSALECLRLSSNSITQAVNGSQFSRLTNLWLLDLSHNKLDLYYSGSFTELPKLKALDLSYNSQSFRAHGIGHNLSFVGHLPSLRYLSLAHNQIYTRVSQKLFSNSLVALDFSGNLLSSMWAEGNLYLQFFQGLSKLLWLDLSQNKLRTLPDQALDNLPKSLRLLWAKDNHITFFNWSSLHFLPSLQVLDLSGNRLGRLATGHIPGSTRLHTLNLSRNGIDYIAQGFFAPATKLRVLNLYGNALKTLDRGWFGGLAPFLEELNIGDNPLHCECDATFLDFLLEIQASVPGLTNEVVCGSPFPLQGKSVFMQDLRLCLDVRLACICFAVSLMGTLLTLAMPTLQRLFGWDLWYIFHLGLAWLPWRVWQKRKASAQFYDYDAFVVFDKAQEAVADWVYNELRVRMEEGKGRGKGRPRFRLCLEDRDWLPGKSLIENLWDSVYNSRKTLFVLSSRGPGVSQPVSGLLRATFHLAQQRLLDDKQDVVVLVILNRAARKSRYVRLRQRLCRQTVLFWPQQPSGQDSFWVQLCTALATNNRSFYNQNFCRGP
ncbi:toll-like receptor 9 [Dromiciops gliroides]|uniref:toll-like receptor 9 n=1 Tax=Dromiciops gliroides TaxID=33562 RepID=UPI001CC611D4|nr:toll-like receptor 9 [Dromiciops gliroides]